MVMGKRNSLVVLSSDDEDDRTTFSLGGSNSYAKSKSKSRSASARGKKKARLSGSRVPSSKNSSKLHEINHLGEDFNEVFTGFNSSAGTQRSYAGELWVHKHKPHSLEELAVHKKKVEEVKMWFEKRLKPSKGVYSSNVLLITGQAGVGKSAAVHVISSHLGATLCEWNTPTPVIWQEHLHNSSSGTQYTSKLDEFETYVEKIRRYGLLSTFLKGESKAPIIVLIDDLPVTNSKATFGRLQDCLHLLVRSTQIPTVIVFTDYGNADSGDHDAQCLEKIQLSLLSAGACKIAFNPITANSIKKVLFRICQLEQCDVAAEHVDLIAKSCGGDIRHAITSLQFFCLKQNQVHSLLSSNFFCVSKEKEKAVTLDDGYSLHFSRDETLSLFHALGKFLHNKRETECATKDEHSAFLIQERFARLPLKMDAPEKILCHAHVQPGPVADFLHENVLDFMNEEAIDDAWVVSSYLGDSDILLAKLRGMVSRYNEAEGVLPSAAASVAVRGVLFGNSHTLSARWHAVRGPRLWGVERELFYNKNKIIKQRVADFEGLVSCNTSVMATEYTPLLKWIGNRACGEYRQSPQLSVHELDMDLIDFDQMVLDDQNDDEIEDW
ncbi:cell cycle checkpoint protein RAD17 [Prosopis cineraria]|uniref:cell cycle checkpoint protein RAD17 n=1 Tax=Prosopis cineraria TaxID=364024 RepID=UPI00240F45EB|nr:cell cycle checkpoint protein RAD17 [Prosopis cineraria]